MTTNLMITFPPFYVGEKIVCMKDFRYLRKKRFKLLGFYEEFPKLNRTYTVRELVPFEMGSWGVRLTEIHNPKVHGRPPIEVSFLSYLFLSQKARPFQPIVTHNTQLLYSIN